LLKIAIFSNDAGSSEILKALYNRYKDSYEFRLFFISSSPFGKIIQTME